MTNPDLARLLRDNAPAINAVVHDAPDMAGALEILVALCDQKAPATLLIDEPGTETGPIDPESGRPRRVQKVLAADLPDKTFKALKKRCEEKGWRLLGKGIRDFASGIDLGVNFVPHAIADSATCILANADEDALLTSAVCEISVMIVPVSGLLPDLNAAVPLLREGMNRQDATYTTFITGSSRTGDIEQVLTLGAHGPVELHIILLEG